MLRRALGRAALLGALAPMMTGVLQAQADSAVADTLRRAVLPAVRVSVTRVDGALRDQPVAVSVVEADAVRARPAIDLDELLVGVPGVHAVNRGNPSQDIRLSIRGFGARTPFGVRGIRVLLDGIPHTLPDGQGQLTTIDPADVARIEVLRGTASTQHGNAAGGVLAIQSRVGDPEAAGGAVRIGGGAFGTVRASARAATVWTRGGVSASGGYTRAEGFREHAARRRLSGALALRQRVGGTTLTTHARVTRDPLAQNPGALTQAQFDSLPRMADPRNVAADAGKAVTQALAGIRAARRWGDVDLDVTAFGVRRVLDNPLAFATIDLDRWAWGARATASVTLDRVPTRPEIAAGLDAQWQRDDRENRDPDDDTIVLAQRERVRELGPFLHVTVTPLSRLRVSGGMRYDRIAFAATDLLLTDGDQSGTRVMDAVSGSVGAVAQLASWFAPYVSASTGFETPTTTELVNRPSGGGGFNPDLAPQRATTVEVGARGEWRRLAYEATYFDVRVRGELIPFEVADGSGRQFFRNAGTAWHRGMETSVRASSGGGTSAVFSYTFADYRFRQFRVDGDVFDGNRLPGVPRHRLYASVRQTAGAAWVALDATWMSSLFADDANATSVDGWLTVDVRAAFRLPTRGARIEPFAMLANAFGRRYVGSVVVNAFGGRYLEPAPGRALLVGVEMRGGGLRVDQ